MTQAKLVAQENPNRQRVVLLATNSSHSIIGEIVDGKTNAIAYSTYGEQSAQQGIETQLGFNGQLREGSIGWYLLGNGYRAYNPRLMRFHSPDSWSPFGRGGLNAYMYCVGDPVNRSDPTGHTVLVALFLAARDLGGQFKSPNYRSSPPPPINTQNAAAGARALQQSLTFEKTHDSSGISRAFSYIAGPKPKNKFIGEYPSQGEGNNNNSGSIFKRNVSIPLAIADTARRSNSSVRDLPASGFAGTRTKSGPPISPSPAQRWGNLRGGGGPSSSGKHPKDLASRGTESKPYGIQYRPESTAPKSDGWMPHDNGPNSVEGYDYRGVNGGNQYRRPPDGGAGGRNSSIRQG
ncbi:RHS repeat-associated core domain-containing protein [Pseudomonas sp. RIT-PI-q]|uniref:RHS repeat-associated core domain-containing protein n=1 Tax=Pseudomonas sp. RIT-PI-q TaxID=1690247 RepID=UPI0009E7F0FE|nr:RHS repeat-associated core domain-containing protein [Pseudomonas sp. RIT-PI-q]